MRASVGSLVGAIVTILLTVLLAWVVSDRPGLSGLNDVVSVLLVGVSVVALLLLGSASFGVTVARQRPLVLWWTVPLLLFFAAIPVVAGGWAAAAAADGRHADDVGSTAAAGLAATFLGMIVVWTLDVAADTRWRFLTWWSVGLSGLLATSVWVGALAAVLRAR